MNPWIIAFGWVLAWATLGGLIIVGVEALRVAGRRRRLRASGVYPPPGAETEADVQRLLLAGEIDSAIRCHEAVHHLSYQQSRDRLFAGQVPTSEGYHSLPFFGLTLGLGAGALVRAPGVGMLAGLALGFATARWLRSRRTARKPPGD